MFPELKSLVSVYFFIVIAGVLATCMMTINLDEINEVTAQSPIATNKSFGFTVEHPIGWQEIKGSSSNNVMIFRAPKANVTGVGIYATDLPYGNISLSEYSMIQIAALIQSYNLLAYNMTSLSKIPAYQAVYTDSSKGTTILEVWTIKDDVIFRIIYLASSNNFDDDLTSAKHIIKSFRFS